MIEVWKMIPNWEGFYEVSNTGLVRSNYRIIVRKDGRRRVYQGQILKPAKCNKGGYLTVCLCKNRRFTSATVHRLVATAFVPNPYDAETVNHIDGDKLNNLPSNLEWISREENSSLGWKNRLTKRGHQHA